MIKMAVAKSFTPVKLICAILASDPAVFQHSEQLLTRNFGPVEKRSVMRHFTFTDYYDKQMGSGLTKTIVSFRNLIDPSRLSQIKSQTNALEERLREVFATNLRVVNLDPGYMTASALVMATVKDFSHRIPLQDGIYAHLELMFTKTEVKSMSWTYPDYRTEEWHPFFWEVRKSYLAQLRQS
jgi:hypothetical protein